MSKSSWRSWKQSAAELNTEKRVPAPEVPKVVRKIKEKRFIVERQLVDIKGTGWNREFWKRDFNVWKRYGKYEKLKDAEKAIASRKQEACFRDFVYEYRIKEV